MKISFSSDVEVEISRLDKNFHADMNCMHLNLYADAGFDIDPVVELCKENGNKFNFTCGNDDMEGYRLVAASENYDALAGTRTSVLNFQKEIL
jgi:hypothetical protein